jgi:hypothetical protein
LRSGRYLTTKDAGARARSSALALLLVLSAVPAHAQSARVIDQLEVGTEFARTAHAFESASAKPWRETVSVGTLTLPLSGFQVTPGGLVRAHLKTAIEPGKSAAIQVTLATSPKDYGKRQSFRVLLDGSEVYRSTESDTGGGPTRSFFVDLASPRGSALLTLSADPASVAPVTLVSLRVWSVRAPNPQSAIRNPQSKMGLALVSPTAQGYGIDDAALRAAFHKLPHSPYLEGQLAILYNFCARTAPENASEIDRIAALAEKLNLPIRVAFQVHWGGSPAGVSDGAGGKFTDLPYQQIAFDPADKVDDPGLAALMGDRYDKRFGLSVPNRWSNTPWLTFNHPRLNQLRRIRLTQALLAWRDARERLLLSGKGRLLPQELSTGDETVYWAKGVDDSKYTEANGGTPRADLSADYNPFVVTDALNDGVVLDPRDGLSLREREWLHRNMSRQQQRVVDWMLAALPADPVRLFGATQVFARDLPRRNIFTEPYAMPLFPLKDVAPYRPGLEVGCVQGGRSGGEYWSGATMLPWLLRERERGRTALPNLECSGAEDPQLLACLQAAYAMGARFATLYNWQARPDSTKMLRTFADSIESPTGAEFPSAAVGMGAKWERDYVAPPYAWGVNRIELYPQQPDPAPVRVTLRDLESGEESSVTATVARSGSSPSAAILLPVPFHQVPGRRYLLAVVPLGTKPVSFGVASDLKIACRILADLLVDRERSQLVASWRDARDLLDSLHDIHGHSEQSLFAREALEKAEALWTAGAPEDAYTAGVRTEQLTLPASFALPAPGGRLTPYWISLLNAQAPIRATITTYSPQAATVVLRSPVAQRITVRWGALESTASLAANVAAEISLVQPRGIAGPTSAPGIARRVVRRRRRPAVSGTVALPASPAPRRRYGPPSPPKPGR